jgi:hypothetical protein
MKSQDSISYHDIQPFLQELEPQSRILVLGGSRGEDLGWISKAGHTGVVVESIPEVAETIRVLNPGFEVLQKNYLFLTLKENDFQGVWINHTFNGFPSEQVQRMVATIFKGLKPGGILGVIVDEGEGSFEDRGSDLTGPPRTVYLYREMAICSMLDQTGFQIKKIGRQPADPLRGASGKLLVLAERI